MNIEYYYHFLFISSRSAGTCRIHPAIMSIRVSYQKKIKVIKKKFNFPSKKIKLIKKNIPSYPGLRKPNAKYKHHEICALHHQKTLHHQKNMFKLFFDDLIFFGGSLVKQLLLAEKVY